MAAFCIGPRMDGNMENSLEGNMENSLENNMENSLESSAVS